MKTLFFLLVLAIAISSPAQAQSTQLAFAQAAVVGATTSQTTSPIYVRGAATDVQGNTYFTGIFGGTISFGSFSLTGTSGYDVFVAKRDAAGNYLWAVRGGGLGAKQVLGLAVDAAGDVVVTGSFDDRTVSFGGILLTNAAQPTASPSNDVFVAKLSGSTQTWLWAVSAGGGTRLNGDDQGRAAAVDVFGNVYVAGTFDSSVAFFGPNIQVANPVQFSRGNVFLAKLTPAGQWVWAKGQDNLGGLVGGLSTDPYGNVYLTGVFGGVPTVFGSVTLSSPRSSSGYVAKIDGAGTWQWAQLLRTARYAPYPQMYAARSDGRGVYVAGAYQGDTLQVGTTTLLNTGYIDSRNIRLPNAYVARLHAGTGAWQWVLQTTNTGSEGLSTPQLDGAGHVLVAGGFAEVSGSGATFGTTTLHNAAGSDMIVTQLDTAGRWLWARQADAPSTSNGSTLYGLDPQGRGLLWGVFRAASAQLGSFALSAYPGQGTPTVSYATVFTAQLGANGPLAAKAQGQVGLALFPNPAHHAVTVTGLAPGQSVQVLDVLGRIVLRATVPTKGDLYVLLPVTLPTGIYVVRAGSQARRLVVE